MHLRQGHGDARSEWLTREILLNLIFLNNYIECRRMSINQHSKNPVKNALTCFYFLEPPFLFPIFNKPNLEKKKLSIRWSWRNGTYKAESVVDPLVPLALPEQVLYPVEERRTSLLSYSSLSITSRDQRLLSISSRYKGDSTSTNSCISKYRSYRSQGRRA